MNALLGVQTPKTTGHNQTTIPYPSGPRHRDPHQPGVRHADRDLADGTQIWKITHNGVDTHPVHFHLFNVQVINRVGWDGPIRPPDPNELGWKETVRMNPLEDVIVALRPTSQVPFGSAEQRPPARPDHAPGPSTTHRLLDVDPAGTRSP